MAGALKISMLPVLPVLPVLIMASLEKALSQNPLWGEAKAILQAFHRSGFQAALAGGAVRDALLGRQVKDFDIASSASPEEALRLFPEAKTQGRQFGVLSLPSAKSKGCFFEIASFRKDGPYQDGRRPLFVEPGSIKEDALRRDFTVNALFYDIRGNGQILDFTGGLSDLKARRIRAVGAAEKRFMEDRLRPLRALRFSLVLGFSIEERTAHAVRSFAADVFKVSGERILEELSKALSASPIGSAAPALKDFGFLKALFSKERPLFDPLLFWKNKRFQTPPADSQGSLHASLALSFASLGFPFFYNRGHDFSLLLRRALKAPSKLAQTAAQFIDGPKLLISPSAPFVEKMKALALLGRPLMDFALAAQPFLEPSAAAADLEALYEAFKARRAGSNALPAPLISGKDLILQGIAPSKALGAAKNRAFALQIERNISKKEDLLKALLEEEKKRGGS